MREGVISELKVACKVMLLMTALTGLLYPSFIALIGQAFFPRQANGSLITNQAGVPIGSALIGQSFNEPGYFWGRPSATAPTPYNAAASGGSNWGPLNPEFLLAVQTRVAIVSQGANREQPVPIELVTASGSGLDPDISLKGALYQIPRIAKARHVSESMLTALVESTLQTKQWGIFGESRVNVLMLNIKLNQL